MKLASCALVAMGLLASSAVLADEDDPCAGRNPLHCEAEADAPAAPAPAPAAAEPDDCEGRNPRYCGAGAEAGEGEAVEDEADVVVMPPGGCEGRNPRYCREEAAPVPAAVPERPRKERADPPNSRNPNRNPNRKPAPSPK